jgi:hypothetical protein
MIDDDVAAALDELRTTNRASLKVLINQALREGVKQLRARPRRREPFVRKPSRLGRCGSVASTTSPKPFPSPRPRVALDEAPQ